MRATTYSLLAALICLASLEHSQCHAAQIARPQYYFPRVVKRQVESEWVKRDTKVAVRDPQLDGLLGITIGLDGILGGAKTTSPTTTPTVAPPGDDGIFGPGTVSSPEPTAKPGLDLLPDLSDILAPILPSKPSPSSAPPSGGETEPEPPKTTRPPLIDIDLPILPDPSTEEPDVEPPKTSSRPPLIDLPDLPELLPGLFPSQANPTGQPEPTQDPPPIIDLPLPSLSLPSLPLPSLPLPTVSLPTDVLPTDVLPTDPIPTGPVSPSVTIPLPTTTPDGVFPSSDFWGTGSGYSSTPPATTTTPSSSEEPSSVSEPPAYSTEEPVTTTEEPEPTRTSKSTTPAPPISTDSATEMYVPTSIVLAPTDEASETQTASSGLVPSGLPSEIMSPASPDSPPQDSVLIQLGFKRELNYQFVVGSKDAVIQIFAYLPEGVAHALEIPVKSIRIDKLEAYDSDVIPYQATVALMYIPSNLVSKLEASLHTPSSLFWNNKNSPVNTIMSAIDPSIPIFPGTSHGSHTGGQGGDGPGSGNGGSAPGGDGGAGTGNSSGVRASAVGIGLGVVGAAALYGAAMFYVARRYRQKRKNHRRTSSVASGLSENSSRVASPSEGLMSDPAYGRNSRNSGGAGSGRTQMISAPVMSENSLGWN